MTLKKYKLQQQQKLEASSAHRESERLGTSESRCSGMANHLLQVVRREGAHERLEKMLELRQKMLTAGVNPNVVSRIMVEVERALAA